MKTVSQAFKDALAKPPFLLADLYTITLADGTILRYAVGEGLSALLPGIAALPAQFSALEAADQMSISLGSGIASSAFNVTEPRDAMAFTGTAKTQGALATTDLPDSLGAFITTSTSFVITDTQLRNAGYLLIKDSPYNADPTFTTECSAGIQQCFDDARSQGRPVYVHTGTYKVNKPLHSYGWQTWNTTNGAANNADLTTSNIQGAWNNGGARPVFKIASGSIAIFDDAANPAPVFGWRQYQAANSSATSIPGTVPANPMTLPTNFTGPTGSIFYHQFKGIDIDTNGHVGAVGLHCVGAQACHVERVKVTATGSMAGFSGLPGAGASNIQLEVVGGQYALMLNTNSTQGNNGPGVHITGLKMSGQTVQGIIHNDYMAVTLAGVDATLTGSAVFWNHTTGSSSGSGELCLNDATIDQAAGLVFANPLGRSMYLRNVNVTGTTALIKTGSNAQINGSGTWSCINEYSCCDQSAPSKPYASGSKLFKTYNLLVSDGALTTTYEKIKTITTNSGTPASDTVTKHYPAVFDQIDTGPYISITDAPYNAVRVQGSNASDYLDTSNVYKKTGQTNNKTAIQNAIDDARTAGHNRVVIPFGAYLTGSTITMHKDTHLIMLGGRSSSIGVHESWRPTSGRPYLIQTDADTEATCSIGYGWLTVPEVSGTFASNAWSGNIFNHILWRGGRMTHTVHVMAIDQFETQTYACPQGRIMLDINGTGGGRHYGFRGGDNWTACHRDSRQIRITGTTQPWAFYGHNMELAKNSATADNPTCGIEITNSSNGRFYSGLKREGRCCSYIFDNSFNVAAYGHGVAQLAINSPNNAYIEVKATCDDILIACASQQSEKGDHDLLMLDDNTGLTITMPEGLAIFKKGAPDDSLMVFNV